MSAQALAITRISVEGNGRISTDEVLALLDGLEGSNVLTADLDEWRGKLLLGSRWVAQATLRRVFPNGVAVVLSERRAVGIGQIDDTPYLIDRSGFIIDEFGPDYADLDLPIVDGLATAPCSSTRTGPTSPGACSARFKTIPISPRGSRRST
jgi:cell division septal protein FtsQ